MAKAASRPVCDMLGGRARTSLEVGVALSMARPEQMAESAAAFKEKGYRFLTVKVDGKDPRLDIARLGAVREAVGAEVVLDVDPNQGYSSAECIPTLRRMEAYDIAGIEQPCPAWDYDGMARVAAALDVPIAMDEGLVTPSDAHRIVQMRAADILTIKLAKSGGYFYAKRIVAIGAVGGLGFTMGSMHTFGVGTAAIHHFAASTPEVSEPIGYGSPLDRYRDDIVTEPASVEGGRVTVPERPGLGVELDEEKLERYGMCVEVR
jgi:muconate cycloisomerase